MGFLVSDHVGQDDHFDRLHASLVTTRHHASTEAAELALLRRAVAVLKSQVAADSTTWNQDTADLQAAYAALMLTQADVSQQSSRIGALQLCLSGVRQALNALAIDNQQSAVSSLNAVTSSCTAASAG